MKLETVKIDDGQGGFIVINQSDFDDKVHKLYVEKSTQTNVRKPKVASDTTS